MSKHPHQSRTERIYNKTHGSEPFNYEKNPSDSMGSEGSQAGVPADDHAIQLRAYQIYCEKGGPALDNWLEAEHSLRSSDRTVFNFIDEGNPNTQR